MKTEITVALISAAGGILAMLVGQIPLRDTISYLARRRSNIPNIAKTRWQAEWQHADGSPAIKDTVTFDKWTRGNHFEGFGEVTYDKQYKYSIAGEVSPTRVVLLSYKAERYPTEASIGTACLRLSDNAQELEGTWIGFGAGRLGGGGVTMKKIKDLRP